MLQWWVLGEKSRAVRREGYRSCRRTSSLVLRRYVGGAEGKGEGERLQRGYRRGTIARHPKRIGGRVFDS